MVEEFLDVYGAYHKANLNQVAFFDYLYKSKKS